MRKKIVLWVRLAALVPALAYATACNKQEVAYKPLAPAEFENLLYELHVADALLKHKNLSDRGLPTVYDSYYNHIFLKYGVSRADFEANVNHYTERTSEYMQIYERLLQRLTDDENALHQVDTTGTKPQVIDSIR